MAEASAEINLSVDYNSRGVNKAKRDFKDLARTGKGLASALNSQNSVSKALGNTTLKWKKHFDQVDKATKALGTIGLKGLSLSLKGVVLEMGLMAGAMLAIHGAFLLGNAAMKAMKATLGPLAAGMTAVVAAGAAAAAAMREQQAAMWAYKNTAKGEFGSGLNQVRQQMRALHTDTYLASAGVENLNAVFATVSKTGTFTSQSQNLLKGLMDFASAGQPIEEGIKKAGDLIAILQDSKKSFSEAKTSAQTLFPDKKMMDKALKDLKITTKQGLEKAIMSGSLAGAAGVEGQFDAVSGTLINKLKGYFNILKNQFADMGQPLLEPIKQASYDIFRILQRGFVRISGNTQRFGMTSMLEGLVSLVDTLTTKATDLINNNLSSAEGTIDKMGKWWDKFTNGWENVTDALRPFIDGARVIEKMFGQVWVHVKEIGASRFGDFNEWLQANEKTVLEFGANIGELIKSLMGFQQQMSGIFQDMLPFINMVVKGISSMVEQMTGFISLLRGLTGNGALGALAIFAGMRMGLGAMKGTKGGFIGKLAPGKMAEQNTQTMNVNAQQVVLGGKNLGTTGAAVGGGAPKGGPAGTPSPTTASSRGKFASASAVGYAAPTPGTAATGPGVPGGRGGRFGKFMRNMGTRAGNAFIGGMAMDNRSLDEVKNASSMARMKSKIRDQRSNSKFAKSMFGDEKSGQKGINNSMTAKMGTGMALSFMASKAPQEAQGALALGGSLAMINPMLGLGVGLGGTALKSKTATGGALTGAAGGAALGAMMGGPAGMAVGAVLGGITGAIMGTINRKKAEVKASKAAAVAATESIVNMALSSVIDTVRKETGVGRSATRDAFMTMQGRQNAALGATVGAQKNLSGGIGGMYMQGSGLRGNTVTKGIEDLTKRELPGFIKGAIGVATQSMSSAANIIGTTISKLGGKSLVNNRMLNPLGFGANNRDDYRQQTQKKAVRNLYRNQKQYGMTMSEDQLTQALKKPGDFITEFQKTTMNNQKAMEPLQEKYNSRLTMLGKITGKTDQEVISLAKTMDVNLFDSTVSLQEQMEKLGLTTVKTAEQFNTALVDGFTSNLSVFDKVIQRLKAPRILNESARAFGDLVRATKGGQATEEQKTEFMKSSFEQMLAMYGSGTVAYGQFMKSFGEGGTAYGKGGPMSDIKDQGFYKTEGYKQFAQQNMGTMSSEVGAQLNAVLASSGKSIDTNQLRTAMEGMSPEQIVKLGEAAQGGFKNIRTGGGAASGFETRGKGLTGPDAITSILSGLGLGDLKTTRFREDALNLDKMAEEVATSTVTLIEKMGAFFEEQKDSTPSWYMNPPTWWNTKPKDTSTPRGSRIGDTTSSRLSQTMGRHSAMDGMLTGQRTITSAYRTNNLGSINSDHVTGRAYDLTGQNLGQYQSLVKAGGGFAEYHGVNGGRHLHVVPGSGIGDNSSPVSVSSNQTNQSMYAGGGNSSGNTYQFYVTGTQNASANEIAEIVMQKVRETDRSNRERM